MARLFPTEPRRPLGVRRGVPPWLGAGALWACSVDQSFTSKEGDPPTGGDPPTYVVHDTALAPVEDCNGLDDDGDGLVDEGFPDDDGNGRVDCLDVECPALDLPAGGTVECLATCPRSPVADPWRTRVKWQVAAPVAVPEAIDSFSTPAVGHLDDDDGDGVIGPGDVPDVVVTMAENRPHDVHVTRWVVALDGATGAEKWAWGSSVALNGSLAIADADGDDLPEIVALKAGGEPVLIEADGSTAWETPDYVRGSGLLSVADLDGDGSVEVVAYDTVLEGATGATQARLDAGYECASVRPPNVGDIDQDGDQEILLAGGVYEDDGELVYSTAELPSGGCFIQAALVQADADAEAEVAWLGEDLTIWDAEGILRVRVEMDGYEPGPPCAGDLDGDGQMELAWPDHLDLFAFELDGTPMWTAAVDDDSGAAGCSCWDVDGDGALEVIFGGEETLYVLDGETGSARFAWAGRKSGTYNEIPAIADVDADGHGEILITGQGTLGGVALTVLEHDGPGWGPAGLWRNHDSSMTNLPDDGSVPAHPTAPWLGPGVFRGRTTDPTAADLGVAITDACVADCTWGPAAIGVQVWNAGTGTALAGGRVAVYAVDGESEREVASAVLPELPAGVSLDTIAFELAPEDIGAEGFRARVDPEGVTAECDTSNNEASWVEVTCP